MYHEAKFKSKKKLGSYPSLSVIFSITLALFSIGVFGALVIYSKELEKIVKETIRLQVYLNSHIAKEDITKIKTSLTAHVYVAKTNEAIKFVSKEEAEKQ